ncbi:hypothetical protein EG328_008619 [Venturia inaequalis]|uniref:Uncharacterized protein n=1 Tax=Venturia inaequalis TaxID=5025 RepID=A0A8H3UTD1_VENIN|nr:hypothetical protein EG328_008619 [Venturia inaequalis]KAE9975980.1 hypothetical protein EG327_008288 [Venturia inaequalis]
MPYFDSDSEHLREPLSPYLPSIDLMLRSIHTILRLEISNTSPLPPFGKAVFRQRLYWDTQYLEELITHLAAPTSRVTNFYKGLVFINDLHVIKSAVAGLLSGVEKMGTQFRLDLVRHTKQKIEDMLEIDDDRMVF